MIWPGRLTEIMGVYFVELDLAQLNYFIGQSNCSTSMLLNQMNTKKRTRLVSILLILSIAKQKGQNVNKPIFKIHII